MIIATATSGHTLYNLKEYILDSADDLQDLPVDCPMGSSAFIIATSQTYMINSSGEWVEIK